MKPKKNPVTKALGAGAKAAVKAIKPAAKPAKRVTSNNRQAFDRPVSGASAKQLVQKYGGKDLAISENVKIKKATSPSGRVSIGGGANQVMNQNVRASLKNTTKAEAKANARGLKAANKPKPKKSK